MATTGTEASVWIDDTELQSLGVTVTLDSEEPMLPSFRTSTVTIPGRHGAYDFGGDKDVRNFALNCVFQRQSYTDLKAQIRDFVMLFLDNYGRPKTVKLRFGDEPEKYYNVKVGGGIPIERLANLGFFTLPLIAYDPFAYAESDAYDTSSRQNPSGFLFDGTYKLIEIFNHSQINTPLKIVMNGTVSNLKITNTSNGEVFQLNTSISNEILTIDGEYYTVTKKGKSEGATFFLSSTNSTCIASSSDIEENLLGYYTGEFIDLSPGNNLLIFEGNSVNTDVRFIWKHRFA